MQVNQSFKADPEIAKWLTNADFRRALSHGHRPQPAQRDVLARRRHARLGGARRGQPLLPGQGVAHQVVDARSSQQANALLDKIGLTKKDGEGFRVRTDNGERLRIQIQAVKAFMPWPAAGRDDRPAVEEDRHLGRGRRRWSATSPSPARATTSTTSALDQRRHRDPLSLPAPRHSRRSDGGVHGAGVREVVRLRRHAGQEARRSELDEDLRAVPLGREPEGSRSASRSRRRSGRSWSTSNTASAPSASRRR